MQWGDRWITGNRDAPVKILVKGSRLELAQIRVQSKAGIALTPDDIILVAGPGATGETKARFQPRILQTKKDHSGDRGLARACGGA
jgi:hypothetical protein